MPSLAPVEFADLPPDLHEALRPRVERLGYLGDFFRYAAHQPNALLHFHLMTESLKTALPSNIAELVALAVASSLGNEYERNQHQRLSLKLGLGYPWVAAACSAEPDPEQLDDRERSARRVALALAEQRYGDSQREFETLLELTDPATAVGVLLLTGRFLAHAAFSLTLGFQAPVPEVTQADDPVAPQTSRSEERV